MSFGATKNGGALCDAIVVFSPDIADGMARASNAVAGRIATGLRDVPTARLLAPVEANEIFLELPGAVMDALEADGFQFYRRSKTLARFVCRFDTAEAEAEALVAALRRHLKPLGVW